MGEMTPQEAGWVLRDYFKREAIARMTPTGVAKALETLLAALPKPERKTPGRVYHETVCGEVANNGGSLNPWFSLGETSRSEIEAGAAAVLKECAVDSVLELVSPVDIANAVQNVTHKGVSVETGGKILEALETVFRRIQERKAQ